MCLANIAVAKTSLLPHMISHPELDRILFLKTVDSTNLEAQRLRHEYRDQNICIVSDRQTAGKGQYGRSWESAAGLGLWMSLFLGRAESLDHELHLLSIYAGWVIHKTLSTITDLSISLKWPNDLMIGRRKCGGILTEIQWQGNSASSAIIGMGINLVHQPTDFPPSIRDQSTSLRNEGWLDTNRDQVLVHYLDTFFENASLMDNPDMLAELWNQHAYRVNESILWQQHEKVVEGLFLGINTQGKARVSMDGKIQTFGNGEIHQVRAKKA